MSDDRQLSGPDPSADDFSRRDFVALSIAAGVAAATTTSARAANLPVTENNVMVKTPDGTCDAAFIHPTTGTHPGVLIWPDAFGLRPSMRDMAKRLAAEGYSVLVPNPFYRIAKAPVFADVSNFNFANQDDRAKLQPLMGSLQRGRQRGEGRGRVHRVPRRATASGQGEEDRHARLLHGRPAGREDRRDGARIASAPARRSTAAVWSRTSPTVRICSRRRSRRGCTSGSRRTTT